MAGERSARRRRMSRISSLPGVLPAVRPMSGRGALDRFAPPLTRCFPTLGVESRLGGCTTRMANRSRR